MSFPGIFIGAQNPRPKLLRSYRNASRLPGVCARRFADRHMIFVPLKFFSFFSWGETRRVSPHLARASCFLVAGWRVRVGRNWLSFAQGVGQNSLQVGRYSVKQAGGQAHFAPRTAHDHRGDGARPVPRWGEIRRALEAPHQLSKTPPTYFWTTDAIWVCPTSAVCRGDRCAEFLGVGYAHL
jgi:hypothetical protein